MQNLEPRHLFAVVNMTGQEQLLLELVNRQRMHPLAEAARYGIDLNADLEPGEISPAPKQPVAPNANLITAARGHSDDMLERNFFAHDDPLTGTTPSDRARAAGYPAGAGENISWRGETSKLDEVAEVYNVHEDLFRSEGHRRNTMTPHYRELGNGVRFGMFRQENESGQVRNFFSIMATENFGNRGGDPFITGVAFTDQIEKNDFYEIGEELEGITIRATNVETNESFTTRTGSSGGYSLQVPDGVYTVEGSGDGMRPTTYRHVVVDDVNQKVDFNGRRRGFAAISGRAFEDTNSNGRRDQGEPWLANQKIRLGSNYEGYDDLVFSTATTDEDGFFQFRNLSPQPYRVLVDPASKRLATTPANGFFEVDLEPEQHVSTIVFGLDAINEPPVAVDDKKTTFEGVSVEIDILANDTDADNEIDRTSIEITDQPFFGQVLIDEATQVVTYIPNEGHQGWDVFGYQVKDVKGAVSGRARVDIFTAKGVGQMWQNSDRPKDVNNDGTMSPIDALLVINFLIKNGPKRLTPDDPLPPPYVDVSGDGSVTAIDAIQVLNELLQQGTAEGERDFMEARPNDASATPRSDADIGRINVSDDVAAAIDAVWGESRDDRRHRREDAGIAEEAP